MRFFLKKNYDNVTLFGDFNISSDDVPLESFLQAYNLTSLIKETTCFQSSNPSCIDLILTNQKNMYKLSNTFETRISDHHELVSTVAKSLRLQEKIYRSYRSLNIETLKKTLSGKLSRLESNSYREFKKAFLTILNKQVPLKTKFLRHNNNPFLSKELQKAITKRSQLKNRYNKNRNYRNWYLYKEQRSFCVSLLGKTKSNNFKTVKMQDITDNEKFWKTIRPYFSDKGYNQTKITIVEKNSIITDEQKYCNSNE